jgi:hypothetical protein
MPTLSRLALTGFITTSNAHQSLQRVFLGDMAISENPLHILHTLVLFAIRSIFTGQNSLSNIVSGIG